GGPHRLLASLVEAHTHGAALDWGTLFAGHRPRRVALPTYAFQHQRYWLAPTTPASNGHTEVADAAFWQAVEGEDPETLAATLGLEEQGRAALPHLLPALSSWRHRHQQAATVADWRYTI